MIIRVLVTILMFVVSLSLCGTVFWVFRVPMFFHAIATVIGAVVLTWVFRPWVLSKIRRPGV